MQVLTRRDEAAVTDFLRLRKVARLKLILLAVDAHRRRLPGCRPPGCLVRVRVRGRGRIRGRGGGRIRFRSRVRVRVKVRVRGACPAAVPVVAENLTGWWMSPRIT